jgi:transposase
MPGGIFMGHISGESRYQTKIMCLDEYVDKDSIVRAIDRFVDMLDLEELGFKNVEPNVLGRNSYSPSTMIKLYVYGYESGVRSSRKLEKLTNVNIEVMWLLDELKPDFKTIADFRKDNIEPFVRLLSEYNSFADYCGLFGKELVAIDGTKIKASNNKKNNYSRKKLLRNIEYSKRRIAEYMEDLDKSDDMDEVARLAEKARSAKERMQLSEARLSEIDRSGESELSTVDKDARLMGNNRSGVDMAYNVQASVDGKEHLVVAFDITQSPSDHGSLTPMIEQTQEELRKKDIVALADKGYYGYEDIEKSENTGALPIVARQLKAGEKGGSKFSIDKFVYERESDSYICPMGNKLDAHSKSATKDRKFFNKTACRDCPSHEVCLKGKGKFKTIIRRPQNDILDRADARYKANAELYRQRQQIVEHVFGTVKHTINAGYYLLRSKEKVKAETAILFLCYNIKRTRTVLGTKRMMELMNAWGTRYSKAGNSLLHGFVYAICRLLRCTAILAFLPAT